MSNKLINYLETAGLNWAVPVVRLCRGEDAREQAGELFTKVGLPLIAVLVFLLVWSVGASQVKTSLGVLPGPAAVWHQAVNLYDEHQAQREKADAFYQRQEERNAAALFLYFQKRKLQKKSIKFHENPRKIMRSPPIKICPLLSTFLPSLSCAEAKISGFFKSLALTAVCLLLSTICPTFTP